jgi:hypothetical protein
MKLHNKILYVVTEKFKIVSVICHLPDIICQIMISSVNCHVAFHSFTSIFFLLKFIYFAVTHCYNRIKICRIKQNYDACKEVAANGSY